MLATTSPPRRRIADWAHEQLLAAVIDGELAPGSRLSVPALAEELGVSRSPVREAVLRLVNDGLAVEHSHRGASVRVVERAELVDVYELREMLEGLAARRAAERLDESLGDDLGEMLDRHAACIEADDLEGHTREDMAFHRRLREAADNRFLLTALDRLQSQIRLAMHSTTVTAGPQRALADHRKIAKAVLAGDGDAAEAAARAHIARLRRKLEQR